MLTDHWRNRCRTKIALGGGEPYIVWRECGRDATERACGGCLGGGLKGTPYAPCGRARGGGAGAGRGEWRGTYVNCSGAGLINHNIHDSWVEKITRPERRPEQSCACAIVHVRPRPGPRVPGPRAGLRHALSASGSRHCQQRSREPVHHQGAREGVLVAVAAVKTRRRLARTSERVRGAGTGLEPSLGYDRSRIPAMASSWPG